MNELLTALPPPDFQKFLLWGIGILISVIGVMWRLYIAAMQKNEANTKLQIEKIELIMNLRLEDKDEVITALTKELQDEKESKQKVFQEFKTSLDSSNSVMKSMLDFMRHGK